jgi:hypothetical protein
MMALMRIVTVGEEGLDDVTRLVEFPNYMV